MLEENSVKSEILLLKKEHKESPKLQNYGTFPFLLEVLQKASNPQHLHVNPKCQNGKCGKL